MDKWSTEVDVERLPALGYTFGREDWARGYATEAAQSVYEYAKSQLDYPAIKSVIHAENIGSRAIVLKFGVSYIDIVELAGRPFERNHWPEIDEDLSTEGLLRGAPAARAA